MVCARNIHGEFSRPYFSGKIHSANFVNYSFQHYYVQSHPPYFGFTASAKVVTAQKRKTAYRRKITAILWLYRLRRSRYRPKIPPYGITAQKVPPSVIPPTKVPPCLSGQKRAPLGRYPITGFQTRGPFFFGIFLFFLFFVLLVLWFFRIPFR